MDGTAIKTLAEESLLYRVVILSEAKNLSWNTEKRYFVEFIGVLWGPSMLRPFFCCLAHWQSSPSSAGDGGANPNTAHETGPSAPRGP
jgi:hypothetical protein